MSAAAPVTTRFAPSPTGFLHIGGARTALFNWLYARGRGGRFLLRIEDTDRERSTQEAVDAILDGLAWLGLDWDEEPVSQASRAARHVEIAETLLASGRAYKDFATAEETEALKAEARAHNEAYRSPWRDRDPDEAPAGAPFAVRFKGPREGETLINDAVQGEVRFPNKDLDDLVLLRSDGAPTYNLAVVVDDHDMGVTQVIRGDDHLVNAARQTLIYQALDWPAPGFAHIPLIHGPDGKKLSKRHGALGVESYRDMGYLPEGLRAYLLRLGWAKGDQEIFTDAEARAAFDLTGVNKAPARLDFDKLAFVNAHFMAQADDARIATLALERLQSEGEVNLNPELEKRIHAAAPYLKNRAKTLAELVEQTVFITVKRPLNINAKAAKSLNEEARSRLARLREALFALAHWREADLKESLNAFAEAEGVGFGKIGQPLRAALTGGAPAPDLSIVMAVLGREETLGRMDDAAARDSAPA